MVHDVDSTSGGCPGRPPDNAGIVAQLGGHELEVAMKFGPNVCAQRDFERFAVKPRGQSQSAANHDRLRIQHVDQLAIAAPRAVPADATIFLACESPLAAKRRTSGAAP